MFPKSLKSGKCASRNQEVVACLGCAQGKGTREQHAAMFLSVCVTSVETLNILFMFFSYRCQTKFSGETSELRSLNTTTSHHITHTTSHITHITSHQITHIQHTSLTSMAPHITSRSHHTSHVTTSLTSHHTSLSLTSLTSLTSHITRHISPHHSYLISRIPHFTTSHITSDITSQPTSHHITHHSVTFGGRRNSW